MTRDCGERREELSNREGGFVGPRVEDVSHVDHDEARTVEVPGLSDPARDGVWDQDANARGPWRDSIAGGRNTLTCPAPLVTRTGGGHRRGLLAGSARSSSMPRMRNWPQRFARELHARLGSAMTVDLEALEITAPDRARHRLAVDPFRARKPAPRARRDRDDVVTCTGHRRGEVAGSRDRHLRGAARHFPGCSPASTAPRLPARTLHTTRARGDVLPPLPAGGGSLSAPPELAGGQRCSCR